jgi:predicted Fe-Mo cluster-binding NifX family protein
LARWFESLGVKTLITSHLGEKPFHALIKAGVKIYFAGSERITVEEALAAFKAGTLLEVNVSNYMELLGEEAAGHKHEGGCHSHEGKSKFKTKLKCCETKGHNALGGHGHKHGQCHTHEA